MYRPGRFSSGGRSSEGVARGHSRHDSGSSPSAASTPPVGSRSDSIDGWSPPVQDTPRGRGSGKHPGAKWNQGARFGKINVKQIIYNIYILVKSPTDRTSGLAKQYNTGEVQVDNLQNAPDEVEMARQKEQLIGLKALQVAVRPVLRKISRPLTWRFKAVSAQLRAGTYQEEGKYAHNMYTYL